MTAISSAPPVKGAPLPVIAAFGSMGLPLAGVLLIFGVYLPRHYVALGVSFAAVSAAIFTVRMIDLFLDLGVGLAMDRTKSPVGRYRLWVIMGVPLLMASITPATGIIASRASSCWRMLACWAPSSR